MFDFLNITKFPKLKHKGDVKHGINFRQPYNIQRVGSLKLTGAYHQITVNAKRQATPSNPSCSASLDQRNHKLQCAEDILFTYISEHMKNSQNDTFNLKNATNVVYLNFSLKKSSSVL